MLEGWLRPPEAAAYLIERTSPQRHRWLNPSGCPEDAYETVSLVSAGGLQPEAPVAAPWVPS